MAMCQQCTSTVSVVTLFANDVAIIYNTPATGIFLSVQVEQARQVAFAEAPPAATQANREQAKHAF